MKVANVKMGGIYDTGEKYCTNFVATQFVPSENVAVVMEYHICNVSTDMKLPPLLLR